MEQKTQKANNYFMLCEIYFVTNYMQWHVTLVGKQLFLSILI